jgi:hypothetical protein
MTPKLDRRTLSPLCICWDLSCCTLNSDFFLMIRFYFFGAFSRALIIAVFAGFMTRLDRKLSPLFFWGGNLVVCITLIRVFLRLGYHLVSL